jgi:hypothetical protein
MAGYLPNLGQPVGISRGFTNVPGSQRGTTGALLQFNVTIRQKSLAT